jgi:hypothetical protein
MKYLLESNDRYIRKSFEELIMTCITTLLPIDEKFENFDGMEI